MSRDVSSENKLSPDASLQQTIRAVAADAVLVDPRIMRRVIRLDRRLKGLGLRVPHDQSYTIDRDRLLAYVDRPELGITGDLAPVMILLSRPAEQSNEQPTARAELLLHYWRLLFQSRVRLAIESRYPEPEQRRTLAGLRRKQMGEGVFAEIRSVLTQDRLLFADPSDWEVYLEFAALALDIKYFANTNLEITFPAILDWPAVLDWLSLDVDHAEIYQATQLVPAPAADHGAETEPTSSFQSEPAGTGRTGSQEAVSDFRNQRTDNRQRALRASEIGNHLKSAIFWNRAASQQTISKRNEFRDMAQAELRQLVDKLRKAMQQDEEHIGEWLAGLRPVLERATASFWSAEARLLYDLQKICVEAEAESRRANLFGWLTSFGREPITRSMPLLKFVQMAKHIRSAQRRLGKSTLEAKDRDRIVQLLERAETFAESLLRETIRPIIHEQLDRVALTPENVPERVARQKLVEEMLDNLVEYGYLTSSMFRDSLSRGDVNLRDVSGRELLSGDQYLLADRGLSVPLNGIYRPAPIYMRWSQQLSSLAFGTEFGRFITMHLALPLGGAILTVESVRHVVHMLSGDEHDSKPHADPQPAIEQMTEHIVAAPQVSPYASGPLPVVVLAIALFIYLLMHRPGFRAVVTKFCLSAFRGLGRAIVEWPARLLRIPLVEQVLYGPGFAPLRTYLLKPGLLTLLLWFLLSPFLPAEDFRNVTIVFLLVALFLNSQIGRHADEWFTDLVLRVIEDLRAKVFGVIVQWVLDVFHRLLIELDRILHTLDEWATFRTRESRTVKLVKFVAGSLWAVVSYFVVLVSTLLIEPQINPIKHFPVVTVSHKLLLPLGPFFVSRLTPFIGATQANTWVWSTIWLIPGIFGFLVWELRGNWRLYAANRPATLRPQTVGHHGESMIGLLRPTFHSGTLPKLFARLRKAAQKRNDAAAKLQMNRFEEALKINQRQVQHFVERELLELLQNNETYEPLLLKVHSVHLATNHIRVGLTHPDQPNSALWILWEESQRQLVGSVWDEGFLSRLSNSQSGSLALALSGLFQRTGVERIEGGLGGLKLEPIGWEEWVSGWGWV